MNFEPKGQIVRLDRHDRIAVPKAHLDALAWPNSSANFGLVAEVVRSGVLRFFSEAFMEEVIKDLGKSLGLDPQSRDPSATEAFRAFRDRYGEATLLKKEPRIRLQKTAIAVLLDGETMPLRESKDLYMELLPQGLEVYSFRARLERLDRLALETTIWST